MNQSTGRSNKASETVFGNHSEPENQSNHKNWRWFNEDQTK